MFRGLAKLVPDPVPANSGSLATSQFYVNEPPADSPTTYTKFPSNRQR